DICRSTDQRTVIAAVIRRAGVGNKLPLFLSDKEPASLYANLCSFVFDYCSRQKVGGTSMTYFILKQLPILSPTTFTEPCIWWSGETIAAWLRPRVLELTYTAWDLQPFARDVGYDGPPFRWDEARRFLLRAELDAAFFHLYGIARDDVDYIMETFPIVKRKDEKAHGEYRTKRVILEIYDEMQRAADTGVPYQTRLTPPPADPAVAHPARGVESAVPRAAAVAAELIAPDLAAIADGAWATPIGVTPENVTLFTLVDLLGRTGGADAEKLRLAALIARKPVLAIPFLADADKAHWQRVIGAEAQPLPANVVALDQVRRDGVDRAWRDVVQQLRGTGALAVDTTAQRWSTGGRFAEVQDLVADKSWVAGRTSWAIQLLAEIECVEAEQNLVAFVRSVGDGTAEGAVS
ncbi:MAG: hypothetical protein M0R80_25835, partial [Proteobacteria bacterium]|nr:hypothetical protein [Pseudomonadota bacterium]